MMSCAFRLAVSPLLLQLLRVRWYIEAITSGSFYVSSNLEGLIPARSGLAVYER